MSAIVAKYLIDIEKQLHNISKTLSVPLATYETWGDIQKVVRAGIAAEVFPIGTEFSVNTFSEKLPYTKETPYTVVAHDHYKPCDSKYSHAMTLMSKNVFKVVEYSGVEAYAYLPEGLSAGKYYIPTDVRGAARYLTLSSDIPSGYQIWCDSSMQNWQYAFPQLQSEATTIEATTSVSDPTEYTDLTSILSPDNINAESRARYGNSNYKESFIRAYLNSEQQGNLWENDNTNRFTRLFGSTGSNFKSTIDSELQEVVGAVYVPCITNAFYENADCGNNPEDLYTVADKFFLPGQYEIIGEDNCSLPGNEKQFPYYVDSSMSDRIKYTISGVAMRWMTRSPYTKTSNKYDTSKINVIMHTGDRGAQQACDIYDNLYFAVVCNIV